MSTLEVERSYYEQLLAENDRLANSLHAAQAEKAALVVMNQMIRMSAKTQFADLIDALRFYADEGNYEDTNQDFPDPWIPVQRDDGERARTVLARYATTDEGGME